jgi:hypothetical protein
MTDLVRSVLSRRRLVPSETLLDCLELADWLGPRIRAGLTPYLTMAELQARWDCPQFVASKRMADLHGAQLIDASFYPGESAYWAVKRVGSVV